jgi:DNA-binding CsgD family transcriptional regulator
VFVGRTAETEQLRRAWDAAVAGRGSVVAIGGEPGIGKTRLLEVFAVSLGARPIVLKGAYADEEGAPPFLGWQEAIRSLVALSPAATLRALLDADAPVLNELVGDIARKIGRQRRPPLLESGASNRYRLYRAVVDLLKRAASRRPVLLLLDDIHWADAPSLALLRFLAREVHEARVMTVATYRDRPLEEKHPLRRVLGEMASVPAYQRFALAGLTTEEIGEYAGTVLGGPPAPKLVAVLARKTGGNPFFLAELAHVGLDQGAGKHGLALPAKVQDLIRLWTASISRPAYETLVVAAMLGQRFTSEALAACVSSRARDVLSRLDESREAGLLVAKARGEKGWKFPHALVRECILSSLPRARRAEMHGLVAERLESFYGRTRGRHASELSAHFARGLTRETLHKYIHYALLASDDAFGLHAYESAEETCMRALDALPEARSEEETAEIFFSLGRARSALNQPERAMEALGRAFEGFVAAGKKDRAIAAAQHPFLVSFRQPGVAALCRRALRIAPAGSLDAGRLQCQLGLALAQEERSYVEALAAQAAALRLARRHGDRLLEIQALLLGAYVDREELRLEECLSKASRALAVSARWPDLLRATVGHHLAQEALIGSGDFEQGRLHAEKGLRSAEMLRDRVWLGLAYASIQRYLVARGDWDAARRSNDRGLRLEPANPLHRAARIRLEVESGNAPACAALLDGFLEDLARTYPPDLRAQGFQHASLAVALPVVHRVTGDNRLLDAAEPAARRVLAYPLATPEWRLRAAGCFGLVAARRGDARAASAGYRRLLDLLRGSTPPLVFCRGSLTFLQWQLATMARCAGERDKALEHYRAALRDALRAQHEPELAWIRYDLGTLLRKSPLREAAEEAQALLRAAAESARRLGLGPLGALCAAVPLPAGDGGPIARLTAREMDVLRLIANGRTNKEIAAELFIAERTAGNHVSNLLMKIGCGNRVEAAALAHRSGLVTGPWPQPARS